MNNSDTFQFPEVIPTPSRFRNPIGKYRLHRTNDCIACGKCLPKCPNDVDIPKQLRVVAGRFT